MHKSYKALLPAILFVLSLCYSGASIAQLPNGAPAPCQPPAVGANSTSSIEFNPPPAPDNTYQAGDVVEICVNIDTYSPTGANWLHGIIVDLPEAWTQSTVNVTITAPSCSGSGGGSWDWYESVTGDAGIAYGPGFFYDAGSGGGALNGIPGDNFGDPCTNPSFQMCFEITLAADCGGGSNPYDDMLVAPTIYFTGDGDSGSWGIESQCIPQMDPEDPSGAPIDVTMNCCDADAGISPGIVNICENGTYCLFSILLGTPDPGGIWTGPNGFTDPTDCGFFDPTIDIPGDYLYTVFGTGGCFNTTTITMEFIDLGTIANVAHCDPGPYDLMGGIIVPEGLPTTGDWYDPAGVLVPGSLVDPATALTGVYEYRFYDAGNCFTTATANIIFSTGGSGGCETFIEVCTSPGGFIPFDYLGCTPNAGGQWVRFNLAGVFQEYILDFDVELDISSYTEDFYLTYILGAPPCSPAFTDLHVTIHNPVNTGIATTTSICVTDPLVLLETLLDEDGTGPVTLGWDWEDLTGDPGLPVLTNPLDPSAYPPGTTLQLNYSGGLPPGSQCYSESLLSLTILPADADAGLDATYEVCETDAPFNMFNELGGTPQPGGDWTGPAPFGGGDFYTPNIHNPGVYTYTVTSSCDSDFATVTITETAQPDAGLNTTSTVCETAGNVDLFNEINGTPVSGGAWTNQLTGTAVTSPYNVTGQCGNTVNFVYTVTSGVCTNFSVLTLNIECAPDAGPPVPLDYCADGSVVVDLFTEVPAGFPVNGTGAFFPDNFVSLDVANAGIYTYNVTGASGAVCPPDVAIYTVNIAPTLTVTPEAAVCEPNQTEYTVSFTISGGTPPYFVNLIPSGANFVSTVIPSGNIYNFTITDSGTCPNVLVSGLSPLCQCLADAQFTSANTDICEGSCTDLIITPSGGIPPYTVEYSDGVNPPFLVTNIFGFASIPVCPTSSTTYTITAVSDNFCDGTPTPSAVTVNVVAQPNAGPDVVVTPNYCGDGSLINLDGIPGTIPGPSPDPGSFPVSPITAIPGNSGVYTYTTNTGGGICPEDNALYTINIDPLITVGVVTTACQPNQTEYIIEFIILTGIDVTVSDGVTDVNGLNAGDTFTSAPIPSGTNYNFTLSNSGLCPNVIVSGVSPLCQCLATAIITSTNTTICTGSCATIEVTASGGVAPYTVFINDGFGDISVPMFGTTGSVSVCPTANTTYTLASVEDANCVGTPNLGQVTVSVDELNNAGSDVNETYCGDASTLFLNTILSGDASGNGSFSQNTLQLIPSNDGTVITYTDGFTVCPDDVANYTINIEEQLSLTNVVVSCLPSQTFYTVSFTINGGDGVYNVAPFGNLTGNSFGSVDIPISDNYNFTISSGGLCPDIPLTGIAPDCNCPATAGITSSNVTVCEGSCTDIDFDLEGDAPYTITYTESGNPIPFTILTSDPAYTLTVCPTTTTTYTLTGVDDVNCTGSAFGSVIITVDEPNDAGSDVFLTYCADGSNINLLNELSGDAMTPGTFSPAPAPSFPAIAANAGNYTYTVDLNSCPADVATYNVSFDPEIAVSSLMAVCESDQLGYIVNFTVTEGVPPMTINGPNGATPVPFLPFTFTSSVIDFATNANYTYTITDSGLCNDWTITNPAPDCNCIAQGSFTGSTTICAGDCAEIVFTGIGDGPFVITYTDSNGGSTTLPGINDGHIITVCPIVATTYTLTAVSDSYCVGEVSGSSVTVNVDTQIQSTSVIEVIDTDNEFFQVIIGLTGGNEATYNFTPAGGSYNSVSDTYTSAWIPCGGGYNITVTDGGVCPALVINNPSFDCGCVSDAGTISTLPLSVCIDESVSVSNNGDETMDGNDVIQYILHDGLTGTIQNVLGRTFDGVFNMNNYPVVGGQTYCIVAAVGNADFSGNVMLADECTSISDCVPVTVNPLPTATIIGGANVCVGETVGLQITFTGASPWVFTYLIDNVNPTTVNSVLPNYTLTASQPGNYTLGTVTDGNGCEGIGQGLATISNFAIPTASISGDGDVCEGSGDGPVVSFTGDGPYTFIYTIDGVNPITETSNSPTFVIEATVSGIYTVTSIEGQFCSGTVSGSVPVTMYALPTATITGGGEVCDGDEASFLVSLSGEAPWTVSYAVDGVPQGQFTSDVNNFYSFDSGSEGSYTVLTVTDENCPGSGIPSDAHLIVNPIPTAEISSNTTGFCIGEEIELDIELDGNPPFDITYVLNEDTLTMVGVLTSTTLSLTPNSPVDAEIILVEDGSNPTCSSEPFSSVYVDAGVLPNAPILADDSLCASYGSLRIGVSSAPGLNYSWEPQDNLDNPNVSNPLFLTGEQGSAPTFYTYVLTATNGECSATDTMTVKVDPGPIARFSYSPDPVMSEDTRVYFRNNTVGGSGELVYYWEFDSLDTSTEEDPNYKFPDGINDDYKINLTVIDAITGCMDDTYEILTVQPEMLIFVPNAFTPDGDGLNDLWGPVMKNIDADDYRLTVFDRLGIIVFETNDPDQKWNGSVDSDSYYAGAAVYTWLIETKNSISLEEVDFKGKVTLIR